MCNTAHLNVALSQPKHGISPKKIKNDKAQTTNLTSLQPMKFVNHTTRKAKPYAKYSTYGT